MSTDSNAVQLSERQFRRFVRTVYEEGFCDGKINGRYQDSDELWPLSKSQDYMERLISIDKPSDLSPEEADKAYDDAPADPISDADIEQYLKAVRDRDMPSEETGEAK